MSFVSSKNNVRAKVRKWCCLCGEAINIGDMKDVRSGTSGGDFFTMHMHPECHAYESRAGVMDQDWYEDISEPAFDRADAIAALNALTPQEKTV